MPTFLFSLSLFSIVKYPTKRVPPNAERQGFLPAVTSNIKPSQLTASIPYKFGLTTGLLMGLSSLCILSMPSAHADMILGTELSPAMCALYPTYSGLRQCVENKPTTINFFRITNQPCQNIGYKLSPLQESVVAKVIPDSNVRRQVWQNYGRCSGMNASGYFRKMTSLSNSFKLPKLITAGNNYRVSNVSFIQQIAASNPGMPVRAVNLFCQRNRNNQSILAYINTCYDNNGRYKACAQSSSSCPSQFYILGAR